MPENPLSRRPGIQRTEESFPQWPCVPPSMAVGVIPFRNLTGDAGQQSLVEGFTDRLVTDLFRRCRGFSLAWASDEPHWAANIATPNPAELKYLVTGSVLRSGPRMLRVNMRIRHGVTGEYLWAGRHESRHDDLASIQQDIAQQISRELKILLLEAASRDAIIGLGGGPGRRRGPVSRSNPAQTRISGGAHRRGTAMVSGSARQ